MKKKYLKHTWCRPGLYIAKSKIDGEGIFTRKAISHGEKVMVFGGITVHKNELDESKHRLISFFPIAEDVYIGLPIEDQSESLDEYLNHSCDPNTWLDDEVTVIAARDIKAGEEITMDAAIWDSDAEWKYTEDAKCLCGSKLCRKILKHDDWKNPQLQKRYRGHFAPYLMRKIRRIKKIAEIRRDPRQPGAIQRNSYI